MSRNFVYKYGLQSSIGRAKIGYFITYLPWVLIRSIYGRVFTDKLTDKYLWAWKIKRIIFPQTNGGIIGDWNKRMLGVSLQRSIRKASK